MTTFVIFYVKNKKRRRVFFENYETNGGLLKIFGKIRKGVVDVYNVTYKLILRVGTEHLQESKLCRNSLVLFQGLSNSVVFVFL